MRQPPTQKRRGTNSEQKGSRFAPTAANRLSRQLKDPMPDKRANRTCVAILRNTRDKRIYSIRMIPPSYKPRRKFMELAIAEAKRAGDRGDYPIGAVITRLEGRREVVIASAGNRVKTSGSSIKHVELETLKYVSSGYGRYLPDFVLYSTHEPCAMCAGACVWSRIGAVVYVALERGFGNFPLPTHY